MRHNITLYMHCLSCYNLLYYALQLTESIISYVLGKVLRGARSSHINARGYLRLLQTNIVHAKPSTANEVVTGRAAARLMREWQLCCALQLCSRFEFSILIEIPAPYPQGAWKLQKQLCHNVWWQRVVLWPRIVPCCLMFRRASSRDALRKGLFSTGGSRSAWGLQPHL